MSSTTVPAPTHVLMTCVQCERPVLKEYSPQAPLAFYRDGCRLSGPSCRCVIKAFIGKTADGSMAYYDMENPYHKTDTQHIFWAYGVGSAGVEADPWTGTVPHHVDFGGLSVLDDFAIQTSDSQFARYFMGEHKDIVRLELDPGLFANQHMFANQHKYSEEPEVKDKNQM